MNHRNPVRFLALLFPVFSFGCDAPVDTGAPNATPGLQLERPRTAGEIVGWGNDDIDGEASPPEGNDYVAIAAGSCHSLALKEDGSVVVWGWDLHNRATPPAGNKYVAIAAGNTHSLALRANEDPPNGD